MSQGGSRVGWNSEEQDGTCQAAVFCQGCLAVSQPGRALGRDPGACRDSGRTELTGVGKFLKDTLGVALSLGAMGESSIVSAISREVTCNSH